jgi:hypothetical protein
MDVGIVSKLTLWYSKAIDLKLKLTIGHKQYKYERKLFHKLCYSNFW